MTEDLEKKKEILDPVHKPDSNLTRSESIRTTEQNQDHTKALASNPDQFPSIANLSIPNKDQIEPFQIIDDGKSIAASRKVEKAEIAKSFESVEPAGNPSFHEGLKALPEGTTPEQLAQYQTDYILRKASDAEAAGTMLALPTSLMLEGRAEKTQNSQETNEYYERMAGFLIGSVQGIGSVAVNLVNITDFAAFCIAGDHENAQKTGEEFGKSLANTIFAGGKLFQSSYDYLYDVGFEGDYSKPFSDIASLAIILNDRWNQLPPREQERRKAEFISQLIADGFVGMAGAQALGKAKTFTQMLDDLAAKGIDKAGKSSKKLAETIGKHVDDLLQPEYALPGGGKIKMKDIPKVSKEDLYNAMSDWSHCGGSTQESVAIKLENYLLNPTNAKGGPKSEWFRRALGFTRENSDELAKQIVFDREKAVFKEATQYGNKYEQKILIKGANGREIVVPFTWIDNPDGVVRLVTVSKLGKK